MSLDAEVYDEMHRKTININYHTHTEAAGTVVVFPRRRKAPGVSERKRMAAKAKISEIAVV